MTTLCGRWIDALRYPRKMKPAKKSPPALAVFLAVGFFMLFWVTPLFNFNPVGDCLDRHPVLAAFLTLVGVVISLCLSWKKHEETGSNEFYYRLGWYGLLVFIVIIFLVASAVIR